MDDFYVPWDGGERYVKKLEARIAELKFKEREFDWMNGLRQNAEARIAKLEAVAEAAVDLQSLYDDSVPVVGGKWDVLEDALRAAAYLGGGE